MFDEVKTGLTAGVGGASQRLGVRPDLVALAKSIGGEARNVGDQPANNTGALTREEMGLRVAEMRARKEYLDGSISPLVTAHLRRQVMEMEKLLDS